MAILQGPPVIFQGDTTVVDTTQKFQLGQRSWDNAGNEFVYLKGVAATAAGSLVVYNNTYATTLTLTTSSGPVAVAMAATVAATFGWYQIFGINTTVAIGTDASATGKNLYTSATAGQASTTAGAATAIFGAVAQAASVANVGTASLTYPCVIKNATV